MFSLALSRLIVVRSSVLFVGNFVGRFELRLVVSVLAFLFLKVRSVCLDVSCVVSNFVFYCISLAVLLILRSCLDSLPLILTEKLWAAIDSIDL